MKIIGLILFSGGFWLVSQSSVQLEMPTETWKCYWYSPINGIVGTLSVLTGIVVSPYPREADNGYSHRIKYFPVEERREDHPPCGKRSVESKSQAPTPGNRIAKDTTTEEGALPTTKAIRPSKTLREESGTTPQTHPDTGKAT